VPMRTQEVADRAGKQADGSAKTREAKLVTVWTAESRDQEGRPMRDPGSVTYSAAIESAAALDTSPNLSDFAERVLREANRRGFTEAQRPVVLGDGSAWIWNTATELFPQATQILDRFHAKEHLSQVGKVLYGDSPEAKSWIQARYDELDAGRLKCLVQALHRHAGQHKEARDCIPTSGTIDAECDIQSSTNKASALRLAWWRPAVKWWLAPGSSGRACTGP
jgi:hypothetical protein